MKVLVFGATDKPSRYAYLATTMLLDYGHEIVLLGKREATIFDQKILTETPKIDDIHTITMYVNPRNQENFEDYLIGLNPKRIIFNPGTENLSLESKAHEAGIETERACTLVMLRTNQFDSTTSQTTDSQ